MITGRKKPSSRFSGRRSWRARSRTKKFRNQVEIHRLHAEVKQLQVRWRLLKIQKNQPGAGKEEDETDDLNTFQNNGLCALEPECRTDWG